NYLREFKDKNQSSLVKRQYMCLAIICVNSEEVVVMALRSAMFLTFLELNTYAAVLAALFV
ncbi:9045_t:CDS:1, partial [Funneliformis caledonium]